MQAADKKERRSLAIRLVVMAAAMFGFGFLLVPLYDVFCEVTGFGGRTNDTAAVVAETATDKRSIELQFVTTVNQYAPWKFDPAQPGMTIRPGQLYEVRFAAANLSDQHRVAQAVPSVAPSQAARYFRKLECFCFTAQAFEANERRELPVRFIVDSDLPDYIDTITLSYTLFDATRLSSNQGQDHVTR